MKRAALSSSAFLLAVLPCAAAALLWVPAALQAQKGALLVYFGTYTGEKSRGIYVSRLDVASGALAPAVLAAETPNPSYLAIHPSGGFLYAANEVGKFEGRPTGSVSAFAVDRSSGKLQALNTQPSAGGGPAHLITDAPGRNVLVANYGGGSVSVLPIDEDGRLRPPSSTVQHTGSSVNADRQKAPHAHSVNLDPAGTRAYVADLGIDKVMLYRFDGASGRLTPNEPPFAALDAGAGPRHFAFHQKGRFAYVINEMHCTITAFSVDPSTGGLTAIQTISTLPAGETVKAGYSTADIQVHPSGRFLFGSNRGHDSIAVFAIDQASGRLTPVEHESTGGSMPRAFGIDPSGTFLLAANQRSDSVHVFRIDSTTGALTATGHRLEVPVPVCVKFVGAR